MEMLINDLKEKITIQKIVDLFIASGFRNEAIKSINLDDYDEAYIIINGEIISRKEGRDIIQQNIHLYNQLVDKLIMGDINDKDYFINIKINVCDLCYFNEYVNEHTIGYLFRSAPEFNGDCEIEMKVKNLTDDEQDIINKLNKKMSPLCKNLIITDDFDDKKEQVILIIGTVKKNNAKYSTKKFVETVEKIGMGYCPFVDYYEKLDGYHIKIWFYRK